MKKRLVSMFLILAMCMGLAVPAFATESVPTEMTVEQVEAEIQAEKDRIYATVYEQLEAQGVLGLMDIYKEILDPQIEMGVIMRLSEDERLPDSIAVPYLVTQYHFPYGGMISQTNKATGAECLNIYMDRTHTLYYLLNGETSFVAYDLLISIYGAFQNVPQIGAFFSVLSAINFTINQLNKNDINDAKGYAYLINVYDPISGERGSTILGWDNYPYAQTDTQFSENIKREFFPESDPWNK